MRNTLRNVAFQTHVLGISRWKLETMSSPPLRLHVCVCARCLIPFGLMVSRACGGACQMHPCNWRRRRFPTYFAHDTEIVRSIGESVLFSNCIRDKCVITGLTGSFVDVIKKSLVNRLQKLHTCTYVQYS